MAKWVTEQLESLLHQLNEVPYTDDRDSRQLTILMNGFAQINNRAMDKAAAKTRAKMREWSLDDAVKAENEKNAPEISPEDAAAAEARRAEAEQAEAKAMKEDAAAEELTRLRPLR